MYQCRVVDVMVMGGDFGKLMFGWGFGERGEMKFEVPSRQPIFNTRALLLGFLGVSSK